MKNYKIVKRARLSLMLAFRNKLLRKTIAGWSAFATLATMCGPAWAAVATGDYLGGAANLNSASSGIDNYGDAQTATYAGFTANGGTGVLDWNKLNVPGGATLEFNSGTFYNVVNSAGGMSTIAGAIKGTASANVYIFNPNGVVFNSGSSVDVGGIFGAFATGVSGKTLDDWIISPSSVPAAIQNASMKGDITVNGDGTHLIKAEQIALAGKNIYIQDGSKFDSKLDSATALAAGDRVTIDCVGGATISLKIPDATCGNIEFTGMSEFEDALVAKAGGQVEVVNGTDPTKPTTVTVKGEDGFAIGDETAAGALNLHVQNASINVTSGKLTAHVQDEIKVVGEASVQAAGVEMTVDDGAVTIGGDAVEASVTATADGSVAIAANGDGGKIEMGDGGKIVGKDVTLKASGTFDGEKDVTMAANSSITANGDLKVISKNGDIVENKDATIVAVGNATFYANDKDDGTGTSNGDVTLAGTANDFGRGGVGKVVNATAKNVTINEGTDDISLGRVEATEGHVLVDAVGNVTVDRADAKVKATQSLIVEAGGDVNLAQADEISGKNVRFAASGAGKNVNVAQGVTVKAAKNVTVDAANDANVNGLLKTDDGSVYVKAGNDINLGAGEVVHATGTDGNVLLEAGGDVAGVDSDVAIVKAESGNNFDGRVGFVAGGNAGSNIKFDSKGAVGKVEGDATVDIAGDVELTLESGGDMTVDHKDGTLTIANGFGSGAGATVNEVVDEATLTPINLADKSGNGEGLVGRNVTINGQSDNLVVEDNAVVKAHSGDVKSEIGGNTKINGTVEAGRDAFLTTRGNLATPGGKIVAGRDLVVKVGSSTPMVNVAVGRGISAVSGERTIAFRTVGGYTYPEVYGNNSETAVFIDGSVAGGNSTDFSILQGYEQNAAFGNFFLMPVFTHAANFFPLAGMTGLQSPDASFAQGYLTSDKGKMADVNEDDEH